MENLLDFFTCINSIFASFYFLITTYSVSFFLKTSILFFLLKRGFRSHSHGRPWVLVSLVLISALMTDIAWILWLTRTLLFPNMDYRITLFASRLAWAFTFVQYQTLALFLERLVDQRFSLNLQKITLPTISFFCFLYFFCLAIINANCFASNRPETEYWIRNIGTFYVLFVLLLSGFRTFYKLRRRALPLILKRQLKILLQCVIAPLWISDFIQIYPLVFSPSWITNSYAAAGISTALLTYGIYHCARKVISLRFLNFQPHVQTITRYNFVDGFKDVLEQLGHTTNMQELKHITQNFFKEAFSIPLGRTKLYIRQGNGHKVDTRELSPIERLTEDFLSTHDTQATGYLNHYRIFMYDEIAFSNFYEKKPYREMALGFLEKINADIFLPIFEKNKIIAYMIIERFARPHDFYSSIEQDEMLVFASYLSNIINLIQNRNLESLIYKEKELQEELYAKHQEINQYKESIRSFLRNKQQKEIGIIFYKNRRFTFGNQTAKEMITVNINKQHGHPITKALLKIARQVEEYKSPQTTLTKDQYGEKLVLSGVPNLEQKNVIITVYHPEISDLVKKQIDALKDPTKWDYLLYLETTESGKLINQLIPSSGEQLLNFKIALLEASLSKKATLLQMPEQDLIPTVELLHHISLRETLHIIKLSKPATNNEVAIRLFGINPLFGLNHNSSKPLLEKLDRVGTIFIQNIEHLDMETQNYLAEFIKYGTYRIFKSDQKVASSVRIICSTHKNLRHLVQEGTFSSELFEELNKTTLSMPSLLTLSEAELNQLAEGFTEQAIETDDFKNLLDFTDSDRRKFLSNRPVSLVELKSKIQQLLVQKSKNNKIYDETHFDPAYEITDPELTEAARLGKHALRDPKIMALLWNKFKSQSKIASLLGVNRSSVNRRCKEYNLE